MRRWNGWFAGFCIFLTSMSSFWGLLKLVMVPTYPHLPRQGTSGATIARMFEHATASPRASTIVGRRYRRTYWTVYRDYALKSLLQCNKTHIDAGLHLFFEAWMISMKKTAFPLFKILDIIQCRYKLCLRLRSLLLTLAHYLVTHVVFNSFTLNLVLTLNLNSTTK